MKRGGGGAGNQIFWKSGAGAERGAKFFGKAGRERSGEPIFLEKRGGGGAGSQIFVLSGEGAGRGLHIFGNVDHYLDLPKLCVPIFYIGSRIYC